MKRYVGLDVSQKTTAIGVVDQEGRTLAEGVTATEPDAIAAFVRRRAPDTVRIGMETGPLAIWLWNELRAVELPTVCMDARHANAGLKVMLAKTDRNDPGPPTRPAAWGGGPPASPSWSAPAGSAKCTSKPRRATPSALPPRAAGRSGAAGTLATRTLLVRMRCDLENQIRGVPRPSVSSSARRPAGS
jgi:transposase